VRLELSEEADADLDHIVEYTISEHGHAQAREYVGSLVTRLEDLAAHPAGRQTHGLDPDLLRIKHRHHFIFFRIVDDVVRVSRILHERMDAARHLR